MVYTKIISEDERGIFLGEERNVSFFLAFIISGSVAGVFFLLKDFFYKENIKLLYLLFIALFFLFAFLCVVYLIVAFYLERSDFLKLYWKENSIVICEVSMKKQNCEIVLLEKIIDFSWDAQKALTLTYLDDKGTNQKIEISLKKKINDSSFAYINRKMFEAVKLNK
jgi:hypothetical protein